MSVVISDYGVLGPFKQVHVVGEKLVCDSTVYPLHLIGAYSVSADDSLAPVQETDDLALNVPRSVTMRQARLALLQAGLLSQVDVVIESLPDPDKSAAKIEWDYSSEVWRDKPFVQQLGVALGLDDAALDALFTAAAVL